MRIAVAISGGVDSLRTAAILQARGHEVFGLHMRLPADPGAEQREVEPTGAHKETQVHKLAARLAIPVHFLDLRESFRDLVIRPFLAAYHRGLTPNPCVLCNPTVKFGLLLDHGRSLGAERFATGHYARIEPPAAAGGRWRLLRGADERKDQSYFLYRLSQAQLAQTLLPLGDSSKEASRRWAEAAGFAPLIEPESQEICFIPGGHYADFLRRQAASNAGNDDGPIVDRDGTVLGRHHGIFNYTIGQRRGLGIPSTEPYYVLTIEPETHTVVVGRAGDLNVSECRVREVNWVSIEPSERPIDAQVRIRNQHRPAAAIIEPTADDAVRVRFETPQRAVTPGQAAVFYQGDLLLGGGTIAHQEP